MKGFLIDTNVISELRKKDRANRGVISWFDSRDADLLYLSVLVVGELRRGIELLRRRDAVAAQSLEAWFLRLKSEFADRILEITDEIAELWGRMGLEKPLPPIDGLLAATALHHGLVLVTRNVSHVESSSARILNPFTG